MKRLQYYLLYLDSVSPTEGNVFMEIHSMIQEFKRLVPNSTVAQILDDQKNEEKADVKMASPPSSECILCKYNVPGHIHPGVNGEAPRSIPAGKKLATAEEMTSNIFFGKNDHPKSPVQLEIDQVAP
jgi:hypothetical protein